MNMTSEQFNRLSECMKSRLWRLENLYRIIDETGAEVRFKLRPAQREFLESFWYYNIILKARQLGFTTFIDILGLDMVLFTPNFAMVIIAETKEKAAEIFNNKIRYPYDHLPREIRDWCRIDACSANGEIKFSNGSSVKVMVSARSGTCQFLHVSEYGPVCAKSPAKAKEIKTGSFPAVHAGSFIFVESTAMGNAGYFYEMVKTAEADQLCGRTLDKQEFKLHFFPWWQNPEYASGSEIVIPDRLLKYFDELFAKYGISLTEEQMAWYAIQERTLHEEMWREFPSYPGEAFKVAQDGAYYGRQFEAIHRQNRITLVQYEPALPVYTGWDLGMSDDTAIWFFQVVGTEARAIDYYENSGEGLSHYASILAAKEYRYGGHFAPQDIEVRELGSGVSRRETARTLGINFTTVPTNRDLLGGIEQCRDLLNYTWFDESKCEAGIKCLENYKKEWDEKHGCYKDRPLHNECSHGADAYRTFAVAKALRMIPGFGGAAAAGARLQVTGGLRK